MDVQDPATRERIVECIARRLMVDDIVSVVPPVVSLAALSALFGVTQRDLSAARTAGLLRPEVREGDPFLRIERDVAFIRDVVAQRRLPLPNSARPDSIGPPRSIAPESRSPR
ncbi:MAG TPA: hypothetical protein VFA96_07205 [Nocardioides sp.]|nr:hypothetical protein [Nocardioides sp.]